MRIKELKKLGEGLAEKNKRIDLLLFFSGSQKKKITMPKNTTNIFPEKKKEKKILDQRALKKIFRLLR